MSPGKRLFEKNIFDAPPAPARLQGRRAAVQRGGRRRVTGGGEFPPRFPPQLLGQLRGVQLAGAKTEFRQRLQQRPAHPRRTPGQQPGVSAPRRSVQIAQIADGCDLHLHIDHPRRSARARQPLLEPRRPRPRPRPHCGPGARRGRIKKRRNDHPSGFRAHHQRSSGGSLSTIPRRKSVAFSTPSSRLMAGSSCSIESTPR